MMCSDNHGNTLESLVEPCYSAAYRAWQDEDGSTAKRLFGCLAAMAPKDERGWMGLATVYERERKWHVAVGFYGVATVMAPGNPWCHLGKARCLMRMGREPQARRTFDLAESLSDDADFLDALERERGER
ncbi:MAG TPA: hypothetical protein PKL73_03400 [Polyangiaceae bacterium]|jgi:Flp pilus assembly protein TadD|nr:MAG: hypothetical protein BWY17_00220 [Deltaproteobacteria bacterium ADurb.Bin207]HNS95971.1 hypothetical protein [Polyangiaceae bacterium]HNZ22650.1 hypothetical protein [Polyangiaceae bacterium]HOD21544.1 hypothetical protein [Polyangiaceae bacterium]HOE48351.1 hypothetical protein [Polyangiaceae bacterium]